MTSQHTPAACAALTTSPHVGTAARTLDLAPPTSRRLIAELCRRAELCRLDQRMAHDQQKLETLDRGSVGETTSHRLIAELCGLDQLSGLEQWIGLAQSISPHPQTLQTLDHPTSAPTAQ